MSSEAPLKRAPSRRIVERGLPLRGRELVMLSCGHVLSVRAWDLRYAYAKTLGCLKCQSGTPVDPSMDIL